jgi:Ran GTPase-activating protein (RanGAP) involved in mRNA processing and transport
MLYLGRDRIGDAGARVLGAALQAIPAPLAVESLVLSRNALTVTGLQCIAPAMKRMIGGEGLQTLDVGGNRLFCDGLATLAGMLPTTLCELKINGTGCGDTGMMALAAVLPALTGLRVLDCSSNSRVGKDGWGALAAALPQVPALVEVEAAWCDGIGNAGAKVLATGLPKALALQYLGLNWCRIGDAGAQALAEVVPRCAALTNLHLWGGEYGDVGRLALVVAKDQHFAISTRAVPLQIRMDSPRELYSEEEQSSEDGDSSEEDLG